MPKKKVYQLVGIWRRCEIGPEKVHLGWSSYPTVSTLAVIMAVLIGSCIATLRTQSPQGVDASHRLDST